MYDDLPSLFTPDGVQDAPLSDEARENAKSIIARGCDRSTPGRLHGLPPAAWESMAVHDAQLAAELTKAEAEAEIHYLTCVHKAAEETKNYRAAIWWLERRRPEVYGRTREKAFTAKDVEELARLVGIHVKDERDREAVMDALKDFARSQGDAKQSRTKTS